MKNLNRYKFHFIFVFLLANFFISANAFGLGWADREWISSGCPSKILGVWKARSSPDKAPHKMEIAKGVISLTTNEGNDKKFFYGESKFIKQARFLQLSLREGDPNSKNYAVWKIRPHLTWMPKMDHREDNNKSNCLIKVLRFKNKKEARFDKYQTWDIYEKYSDQN